LSFKAAYTGARLSDAFSSIFYAGNGVVLAGKRSNTAGNRIFRSTDHGRSWKTTPEPSGYSGAHVYFFDKNNETNVIVTGTGDTGNPCLLRSTDMGQTWKVVLSASAVRDLAGCDPHAIFSPLSLGKGRWIACLRNTKKSHIIESTDDGVSWHMLATSGLKAGCRKMILTSYGHILCGGCFGDTVNDIGLYMSQDGGRNWKAMIPNWYSFAGLAELPDNVLLAGSVSVLSMDTKVSSVNRTNNRVYVTMANKLSDSIQTGSCVGFASMYDPTMNVHPCVQVTVTDDYHLNYPNSGADVSEHSESNAVILPENPCTIYRSTDRGNSWNKVATVNGYSLLTYVREIRYLGNGLVYAFVAGNENEWRDRSLAVYRSTDSGASWSYVQEEIYVGKYGRLNSVYQTALTDTNVLVAATQPDSDIIIHEGPFN